MRKYEVHVFPQVTNQLAQHARFIANVSKSAARRFRDAYAGILDDLAENPYQFPLYDDPNLPPNVYRKALFATWYKVVFYVEETAVYVEAVVDGRADWNRKDSGA